MLRDRIELFRGVWASYSRHACPELAAAIAYRVLFSLVPFIAVLVAILGAVLPAAARDDLVSWLLGAFPGATVETGVTHELESSGALTSLAGLVAFGTLMWTASGMTRSLRVALAVVWEVPTRPAFVRAKLRDLAALGVLAALLIGVFVLSLLTQIAVQAGTGVTEALGISGAAAALARGAELAATGGATFAALVLVYRLAVPVPVPLRAVWKSALMMAVAIDVSVAAYAFYLVRFADLSSIYGPLGAVLAFLALIYVAGALVLFGAELIVATYVVPPRTPGRDHRRVYG